MSVQLAIWTVNHDYSGCLSTQWSVYLLIQQERVFGSFEDKFTLSPFGCFILMTISSLKQLVVLTCITCLPVAVENGLLCCWVHTVQKYVMLLFCSFFMQLGKYTAYQPMPHFPLKIALDENVSSVSEMLLFETWIDNVGSRIGVENQNSFYSFLYLFFSAQK